MTTIDNLVTALRSGKFTQAKGALRTEGGHCCLGVACQVYADDNPGEWQKGCWDLGSKLNPKTEYYFWDQSGNSSNMFMTNDVYRHFGFEDRHGHFYPNSLSPELQKRVWHILESYDKAHGLPAGPNDKGSQYSLADLNDRGADFKLIAEVIADKPKGLFKA